MTSVPCRDYFLHTCCCQLCGCAMPGEGLYQVLETVESGLLATDDDADDNGDASEQKPAAAAAAESGMCDNNTLQGVV